MLFLSQWAREFQPGKRPWLILGKGPSFELVDQVDLERHEVCSLNHVVRELPVTLAHVIDLDVVQDCAEEIERNARYLIMPFRPHIDLDPTEKTLLDLLDEVPVLGRLEEQGRLIAYNLSSSAPQGDDPVIEAKFFSAEAALNVLATCGVREVRSLGVDGGDRYGAAFEDLSETTRLLSGHSTFDLQFEGIAKTLRRSGIFYAPWHVPAPVRVFIGSDMAQILATKVLEFSIKKHASLSVEVQRVDNTGLPEPRDPRNRTRTGFSFGRFRIPELCGHEGRGIYLDADMLVFQDIARLWTLPFAGKTLLYAPQPAERQPARFSVLLLDCERLGWDPRQIVAGLDAGDYGYKELMGEMCVVSEDQRAAALPPAWNSLEHWDEDTCLIHYTDMPTQPWVYPSNPHGQRWYAALREALEEGFISRELLDAEIAKGHVSPELPGWAGLPRPRGYHRLKAGWSAPFLRYSKTGEGHGAEGGRLGLLVASLRDLGDELRPLPPSCPRPAMGYELRVAEEPLLEELHLEWDLRRGDASIVWRGLAAERALFEDPALGLEAPLVRLVVTLSERPDEALRKTLRLWSLQSAPLQEVTLVPGPGLEEATRRWLERTPPACPARIGLPLEDLQGDPFLVFARPGDMHHPSLVAALARFAPGADVAVWDSLRRSPAGEIERWRTPGLEPLTLSNQPCLGRACAVRSSRVRPFERHLLAGDGHPLRIWLSQQGVAPWRVLSGVSSLLVAGAPEPSPEAYAAAFEGSSLSWDEAKGRPLPPGDDARISVVIPFRDAPELTCRSLSSVLAQRTRAPSELVLVDNQSRAASRHQIAAFLRQRRVPEERVRWVDYPFPFNHSRQCNLGVEASSGEVVVLLNNDAELVEPETLQVMADWTALPGVATVGCRLTGADGRLISAGWRPVAARRDRVSAPFEESTEAAFADWIRESPGNSFACAAIRRSVFETLGPLDALAFPAGYNDVEYCLRASSQGLRHLYLGSLRVVHEPGGSRLPADERQEIAELWRRYPASGRGPRLERQVLCAKEPSRPRSGGLRGRVREPVSKLWRRLSRS